MPAIRFDLDIEQGASFEHDFVLLDGASAQCPPMNLTGYSARMHIRSVINSNAVLVNASTANGQLVIEPLLGMTGIRLSAAATAALHVSDAVYDIEQTAPDGKVYRLAQGLVRVSLNVTRDTP